MINHIGRGSLETHCLHNLSKLATPDDRSGSNPSGPATQMKVIVERMIDANSWGRPQLSVFVDNLARLTELYSMKPEEFVALYEGPYYRDSTALSNDIYFEDKTLPYSLSALRILSDEHNISKEELGFFFTATDQSFGKLSHQRMAFAGLGRERSDPAYSEDFLHALVGYRKLVSEHKAQPQELARLLPPHSHSNSSDFRQLPNTARYKPVKKDCQVSSQRFYSFVMLGTDEVSSRSQLVKMLGVLREFTRQAHTASDTKLFPVEPSTLGTRGGAFGEVAFQDKQLAIEYQFATNPEGEFNWTRLVLATGSVTLSRAELVSYWDGSRYNRLCTERECNGFVKGVFASVKGQHMSLPDAPWYARVCVNKAKEGLRHADGWTAYAFIADQTGAIIDYRIDARGTWENDDDRNFTALFASSDLSPAERVIVALRDIVQEQKKEPLGRQYLEELAHVVLTLPANQHVVQLSDEAGSRVLGTLQQLQIIQADSDKGVYGFTDEIPEILRAAMKDQ